MQSSNPVSTDVGPATASLASATQAPPPPLAATSETAASTPVSEKENGKTQSTPSLNKTYAQLIHEAIVALKDRTGSSTVALTKWIQAEYPETVGPYFKTRFSQALKTGVKNGRFTKVRNSYKISTEWKAKEKARKAKAKKGPSLEETKAKHAAKLEALASTMSPEDLAKEKAKMARREAATKRRVEAEAKALERAERLKKRRFPMEDTKLHWEDKEFDIKPPTDVTPRPYLPYFWQMTRPLDCPSRKGKTSSTVLTWSKADGLDYDSRGLVSDLLQVYHFFRGDVRFVGDDPDVPIVPPFSLEQLVFATEQVLILNARSSRMVPPLLVHLFCTCLQILCSEPEGDHFSSLAEIKLRKDLHKFIAPVLTPASWADAVFLYMDAMERYYTSDASRGQKVVKSLNTDIEYLLGVKDEASLPMTPFVPKTNGNSEPANQPLPPGYYGYLGDPRGILYRAHYKLGRQDPWTLNAEELMALLLALTDDVLAMHPAIGQDLANRGEEMQELLRAKRAADAKLRKVRLAFEGPKKPPKKVTNGTDGDDAKGGKTTDGDGEEGKDEEVPFKPTATKKQFDLAKKAQEKASEAYEEGIRKLVARTEPVGYDRNFNAVYCFRHDPEVLYVEDVRSASGAASHLPDDIQIKRRSWHVVETTSLFDLYVSSLDIRGRREHDLYEELIGPPGANQSLRRYLYDDIQEYADANQRVKEREALQRRLDVARLKCDEENGRRSGRLAGAAETELAVAEADLAEFEKDEKKEADPDERDYEHLTGLKLLRKFDKAGSMQTRRTREKRDAVKARNNVESLQCSKLVSSGNIDGTGVVGMMVAQILDLEEHCQGLVPWEDEGKNRSRWISQLEGAVRAWNSLNVMHLGPPSTSSTATMAEANGSTTPGSTVKRGSLDSAATEARRPRIESPMPATPVTSSLRVSTVLEMLKQPLLDLEERVADLTNLAASSRDADLADDNMSEQDEEEDNEANKEHLEKAWKKIVHRIREMPSKRHVQIRDMLVSAIAAARKAHLPEIVAQLRSALLQYHPYAAGSCKTLAVKVLEEHGDYDPEEDDEESDNEEEANDDTTMEIDQLPSMVAAEAAVCRSSLGGSLDARRKDWIDAVRECKSLSRLASLAAGFVQDAMDRIEKMEIEHADLVDAIKKWEREEERQAKKGKKKTTNKVKGEYNGPSEVWANVRFTDEIIMAKAEDYPWWPAKECVARDPATAESLDKLGRCLVSLVGESGGLRVVMKKDIKPFTGKPIEDDDLSEISKESRNQLDDCLALARRILRGRQKFMGMQVG